MWAVELSAVLLFVAGFNLAQCQNDAYGPIRYDDKNRIRFDLMPMTCAGKYDEQVQAASPDVCCHSL